MSFSNWISGRVFKFVHGNNLVYNTCWEDPRLDREALQLKPTDRVMVITSAGCNTLDYALAGPEHVYAVDMNPRQNALLELKMAAIRRLDFEDFFQLFGRGHHPRAEQLYRAALRDDLSSWSQGYWDRFIRFFDSPKRTFYYRGTSGAFARGIRFYIERVARIKEEVNQLLECQTVEEQREIYDRIRDRMWTRMMNFVMQRDTTLSLVGVPKAQRMQIDTQYPGGILKFIQDCVEAVFAKLPLRDNYFWRVYITGYYTRDCCPEYLKAENFDRLRNECLERISVHTDSVQGFLDTHDVKISRFVLLDHMDWLSAHLFPMLELEWRAILKRADENTRILWRSGGLRTDFISQVMVEHEGRPTKLPGLLKFHSDWAAQLHERDRVHTYGSFYIADLLPTWNSTTS